jgi:hypothetical protein
MNPDPQPWNQVTTCVYDAGQRLTVLPGAAVNPADTPLPPPEPLSKPRTALFDFEHDPAKGIFRIQWPDGETEVFRDKPVRHLVVEPDPETGAMKPDVQRGCPTYLYLCREEREIR